MTTRTTRIIGLMLAPWIASTSLIHAEPIGRPTPPPCAAEGACTPHRPTWGYTRTTWRPWPGTQTESTTTGQPGAIGADQVTPTDPPDPRSEDKLAPPKVDALEPLDDLPPADDEGIDLPDREEFDAGGDRGEGEERPAPPAGGRPPFLDRGPFDRLDRGDAPAPGQPPAGQPPAAPDNRPTLPFGQVPRAPEGLFPQGMNQPKVVQPAISQSDLPPPLPQSMRRPSPVSTPPQAVMTASATTGTETEQAGFIPADFSNQPGMVQQQSYQVAPVEHRGDAPPSLPVGLFQSR